MDQALVDLIHRVMGDFVEKPLAPCDGDCQDMKHALLHDVYTLVGKYQGKICTDKMLLAVVVAIVAEVSGADAALAWYDLVRRTRAGLGDVEAAKRKVALRDDDATKNRPAARETNSRNQTGEQRERRARRRDRGADGR